MPTVTRSRSLRLLVLAASLVLASACAETDRDHYVAGAEGIATLSNPFPAPLYLPGCAPFVFERRIAGAWIEQGPPFVCFWEGFALPIGGGESVETPFVAPSDSGLYRLRYEIGIGCDPDQPLSPDTCDASAPVYTRHFDVEREVCAPSEPGCEFVPGAPNVLCKDGEHFSGPAGVCARDSQSGGCGYEFLICP